MSPEELQITEISLSFIHSLTRISMHMNKAVYVHAYLSQLGSRIILCSHAAVIRWENSRATVLRKCSRKEKKISHTYIAVIYQTFIVMLTTTLKLR